jgi:hypothetical protein
LTYVLTAFAVARRHPKKLAKASTLIRMAAKVEHTPKGQKYHDTPLLEVEETAMDHPKFDRRELQRTVDLKAKLLAVLSGCPRRNQVP